MSDTQPTDHQSQKKYQQRMNFLRFPRQGSVEGWTRGCIECLHQWETGEQELIFKSAREAVAWCDAQKIKPSATLIELATQEESANSYH